MTKEKKRSRRWLKVLVVLLILLAVGWQVGKRYLDIERYRAMAITEIERRTGLPAEMGEATLRLWPTPRLVVRDILVGGADFGVRVARVDAQAELGRLFQGKVGVSRVVLRGLVIDLPAGTAELEERVAALRSAFDAASGDGDDGGTAALAITVGRVEATDFAVRRGGEEFVTGSVAAMDILSGAPRFEVALSYAPAPGTTLEGGVQVDLRGGAPELTGSVKFVSTDLWALAGTDGATPLAASAEGTLTGTLPNNVGVALSGTFEAKDMPGLDGTFLAKAWWTDGQVIVNDIVFDAPALHGKGDVTRGADGAWAFEIHEAGLNAEGLTLAAAFSPLSPHVSLGGADATLTVTDLLGSLPAGGPPRLVRGAITMDGVDVLRPGAGPALEGVAGSVRIEENVITIDKITALGLALSGTVSPDLDTGAVGFDLQATATLSDALAGTFFALEDVTGLGGTLDFKRIAGTWKPGLTLPEGLVIQGAISDGRATLEFSAFQDTVSGARAEFTSDGKAVKVSFSAASEQLGPLQGTANYALAENVLEGTVTLDLARAAAPFLPKGEYAFLANAVAASYGVSSFDYRLDLPAGEGTKMTVRAKRQGKPGLEASLEVLTGETTTITSAEVRTELALDLFADALPEGARAQGVAAVTVTAEPGLAGFTADADLTHAVAGWGDFVKKRAGDALTVRARGAKRGETYAVETLRVEYLGETLDLELTDAGLRADNFTLRLAPLARLFPQGASAKGTVSGSMALEEAPSATLRFEDVAVTLPQGIVIDRLAGEISGSGANWACKDLLLVGLNSDATFNGNLRDNVFKMDVRGKRLDGSALLALAALFPQSASEAPDATPVTAPRTARKQPAGAARTRASAPGASGGGLSGEATINLGALAYRRGEVNDVRANVRMDSGVIVVENLTCRPNTGVAKGSLRADLAGAGGMTVKIQFENADMAVVDAMLLEEPRGLAGTVTGSVDLRLTAETGKGPLSGLNGDVIYVAQSGSYGKFGIATKLLGVLRTTQILQLSRPKLGQSGLVFTESNVRLHIQDGVLDIQQFDLSEPAYALAASGYIDFPNDDMNVEIRANLFDSVTGIVALVPGLRKATEKLREKTALKLTLSGSPRNPNVREEHGVEGAKETIKDTEDLVREGIREILRRVGR